MSRTKRRRKIFKNNNKKGVNLGLLPCVSEPTFPARVQLRVGKCIACSAVHEYKHLVVYHILHSFYFSQREIDQINPIVYTQVVEG